MRIYELSKSFLYYSMASYFCQIINFELIKYYNL